MNIPCLDPFADSLKFCEEIGGVLAVAESNMKQIFWTGWTDEREEGQFVSAVTGEKMEWQNWIKGFKLLHYVTQY